MLDMNCFFGPIGVWTFNQDTERETIRALSPVSIHEPKFPTILVLNLTHEPIQSVRIGRFLNILDRWLLVISHYTTIGYRLKPI